VNVTGSANGGAGGAATGTGDGGSGASASVTDAVDGATSGSLTLNQNVTGGNSGNVQDGTNGVAGSAYSSLTKDVTADGTKPTALIVTTDAFGGNGGSRTAATGAAAGATGTAISDGGTARADTDARGGVGGAGYDGASGGAGGDSIATATASTSGDGNTVDVNGFAGYSGSAGNGGTVHNGVAGQSVGGAGGDATGTSTGTASGNSTVTVTDYAYGGDGGDVASGEGSGGAGGTGTSSTFGSNAGAQSVTVQSYAHGGAGGTGRGTGEAGGAGGDATASASGTGGGFVNIDARATGGAGGTGDVGASAGLGGNAFSTAAGSGASGSAYSASTAGTSNGYLVNDLQAIANAPVASTVSAQSAAQYSGAGFTIADAAGQSAVALGYGAPTGEVSLPMVFANPVQANFDITGTFNNHTFVDSTQLNSDVYGVGVLGGAFPGDGTPGAIRTYSSDLNFDVDLSKLQSGNQNLLFGFMNPVITGDIASDAQFQVTLQIQQEGSLIVSQTFNNQTDLLNYFGGVTHNLAPTDPGSVSGDLDIDISLDVRASQPDVGFAVDTIFGNSTVTPRAVPYVGNTVIDTGEMHIGDTVLAGVEVTNAATGTSDGANGAFTGTTGDVSTNSGTITGLAPQATDNSSLQVSVDSSASGVRTGTTTVQLSTDGTQSGIAEVFANALVQVAGTVYELADPTINNVQPIALGNFREGDTVTPQALSITNNALDDGYGENLDASAGGTTGGVIASGSFDNLAAQGTDSSSITVLIDTATAGDKSGLATIDFVSDGDGINSLGQTVLASQYVSVTGAVYRLAAASAHSPEPVELGNIREGDSFGTQALTLQNTAAADDYSESLDASFSGTTGGASASGAISLLGAQATDSSSLVVGLGNADTSTAGAKSGTATLALESDGTGTSDIAGNVDLGTQTVNVSGAVYRLAEGSASPDPVSFGNVHVGNSVSQALTVSNTAANDDYSESLGVSAGATGDVGVSGTVAGLIAAGGSDSNLSVSLDTSVAGNRSGTVELAYSSDGTGTSGLAAIGAGGQSVAVSGAVYRLVEATIDNAVDFDFGSVHVGDVLSQAVSISNTAEADAFSESLNAGFGGVSDSRITTNGGAINQLVAGGTDASSMVVGVDTSAAGTLDGTVTLNFASDGTGTSGLGITALPSQDLTVTASISATAYNLADPVINNTQPIGFGNFREGDVVTAQALSITNAAPDDGFSEALNAAADGTTGGVLANGSFNLLGPQQTNDTDITVSIDTGTAGDKSGVATIDFESDGAGTSELGITPLPSPEGVSVTGAVYRLAQADVSPNPIVLNARVGDTVAETLTIANTAANDGYSEQLSATLGSVSDDFGVSGSIGGLIDAGSADTGLTVSIDTSSSGAKSGSVSIDLESDGSNTSGFISNVLLGTEVVAVSGNVWQAAAADVQPDPVDFGIVHVGDSVSQNLAVTNTATGALVDVVRGGFVSTTGPFSGTGDLGAGVASGVTDNTSLAVGLDTSTAGVYNGTTTLGFASHNDELADLSLGTTDVSLLAQVNEYANPVFDFLSGDGAFTVSDNDYLLNFGRIDLAAALVLNAELAVMNDVVAPADNVDGLFDITGVSLFDIWGFDDFVALAAGDSVGDLLVQFDTTGLGVGVYSQQVFLTPFGWNNSGFRDELAPLVLTLRGEVYDSSAVPAPSALFLILGGVPFFVVRRWREQRAVCV
jgi:hypothetical protein